MVNDISIKDRNILQNVMVQKWRRKNRLLNICRCKKLREVVVMVATDILKHLQCKDIKLTGKGTV